MASFDLETFLRVQGTTGASTFESIGMSFGIPSCILGLSEAVLSLIPSNILGGMSSDIQASKSKARSVVSDAFKKLTLATGIIEFDTETGTFKFKSDSSWMGKDDDDGSLLDDLNGLVNLATFGVEAGTQIFQNVVTGATQLAAITDCLGKLGQVKEFSSGKAADQRRTLPAEERDEIFNREYAATKASLDYSRNFIQQADEQLNNIGAILRAREADPNLEPCFLDARSLDSILLGTSLKRCPADDPGVQPDDEEIFRLTYGPPVSSRGQYVLTEDGLYYDSRSGGLDPVFLAISGIVPVGDRWKYDYDPNLGGKGDAISIDSLNKFKDNIFDPTIIDDSLGIKKYYDDDHFLAVLKQQRDKYIYDLSSDLKSYIDDPAYGPDSSVVANQRQLIISELANHNNKINRRKKQIEVAVKAPQIYGGETQPLFPPGEIPINDFSYLEEYNLLVDLEKQRALIFEQAEVNGVVLPIKPKFVAAPTEKSPSLTYEHLHVPNVGKGSIIYTPSGTPSGTVLSLTDQIVAKDLFAIYNFLSTDLVLPSSMDYKVTNCATEDRYNDAQLVGTNRNNVFLSGLAIPYLEGITKKSNSDVGYVSAVGSFGRLPDTPEFRELAYSPSGFTMEFWTHVPNITDGELGWLSGNDASCLTKAVIACENTGVKEGVSALTSTGGLRDLDYLRNNRGDAFARGMVCGFTRDRRITQENTGYSNDNASNDPVSSLSFFIAPTQARDTSSASWINNDDCEDYATFHKMKVDLADTAFGNVSSQFVLVDVTCDPQKDEVKFFADGALVATSALSEVFGVEPRQPISLPSFKKQNSFEYSYSSVDGVKQLKEGPKLNDFYTPWIIGGGYTDGLYSQGFMGGDRGGKVSGLRGHLGSLKFYSRPLNNDEVERNYKAQEGFFKNIQI